MSFFHKTISVPENTAEAAPHIETIDIQSGVVHRVHISIPSGHAGLTGVRVLRGLHQVAPTSASEWFQGDDMELDYQEYIEIAEAPFELTIESFNLDDTYAHTFRVGIGVLPEWVLVPQLMLRDIMTGVSEILGGITRYIGMRREV
jgi:hypothetical protein